MFTPFDLPIGLDKPRKARFVAGVNALTAIKRG
jgi:hypothetical protein